MSKALAEQSHPISIFWLKQNGFLIPKQFSGGVRSGTVSWLFGSRKSTVRFIVATNMEERAGIGDYINLQYTRTNQPTGEKEEIDIKVPLTTTHCNYGGVRYWFECTYCGSRVGVIYKLGTYFGCRKCGNLAYLAQMEGGKFRVGSVNIPKVEQAEKEVGRFYYNGKQTRKYRRLLRLSKKLESNLARLVSYNFHNMF